ncbi:MAG: c-type cytochrome [Pseudomonadota bacterium]
MNDPLFWNKAIGAGLTALLIFFALPQIANAIMGDGGHHGHHGELKLAYPIEFQSGDGAGADAAEEAPADLGTLLAGASASAGERAAGLCKSCHSFDKGGANGAGPALWGVVGRDIASVDGFGYTAALTGADGAWTYDRLDAYLKNSQAYISGTAMLQKINKDEKRANILAYLASLSDEPVAYPEPATDG